MYVPCQNQKVMSNLEIQTIYGYIHESEPLEHTIERYSKDENNERTYESATRLEKKRAQTYLSLVLM